MLENELIKLGLSEKEAKVYLAALELGASPVQKISQKAKVNRATTYVVIEDLMQMGIMSTYDQGKKTYFVAEQPERLLSHLKGQEEEIHNKIVLLQDRLPELKSIFNAVSDKPKVKYYEGVEGLRTVREDFIDSLADGDEILAFVPLDYFTKIKDSLNVRGYIQRRMLKNISYKTIYTSKFGRQLDYEKDKKGTLMDWLYIDDNDYPFEGGMNIYGNKVFFIDYQGRTGGIVIENESIANLFRCMFKLIWKGYSKAD